ncbi:rab3 GTPase-activating protein regulatory subunit [Teleopsis dalmanni]|uniref:rab3 GTPase-activating protein regulatory subunit n=1 Tax=Teleopsis dalmanni TaxID=139649 RepID=UPI0018CED225|nr:rab3 GTPase-activating protein regulatory subunit [Teleopsis dalmanni]
MSCEVKTFGNIKDFNKVQEYFGLSHDENWMNAINFAVSPTGELIAFGQGEKLAFLSSCWDNKNQATTYALTWCGELDDPNQIVTCFLCLPIYGKNVSVGPEWTCVVVGLDSGMLLFYTDAGIKIYSQNFHDEPVLSAKSYSAPKHSEADSTVYIAYEQCICIIKGSELYSLLNTMRNNTNYSLGRNSKPSPETPTYILQYQKFKYMHDRGTIVNDAVIVCPQRQNTFDFFVEQCLATGYYTRLCETPVQNSLVIGVGAEPYLGFYYAEEGYKTISLGEVAKDVIGSAYKNILGNIFGRAPAKPVEEIPSPSKESQMRVRSKLFDGKRDGFSIVIAPNGKLAAVTDNLDRVMLVDTQKSVILRVWKGYRDAQCAFMPVKEKTLKGIQSRKRKALFLIIYAPRLGCLEIWALQNGPKIAAFTVSKSGQLAYNTHGLLGMPLGAKVRAPLIYCLFIDPSDGSVKEIQIPFHYALSETNSQTARDIHLLKRFKNLLRNANISTLQLKDDIFSLAEEFQTIEVQQQCLEILKKNKQLKPEIFQAVIVAFATAISKMSHSSAEIMNFQIVLENYKRLVDFYLAMKSPKTEEFDEEIELNDSDLVTINQLVLLLGNRGTNFLPQTDEQVTVTGKVTFQEVHQEDGDFVDYLSIFQLDYSESIPLIRDKSQLFGDVSGNLFGKFFDTGLCFNQFKTELEKVQIPYEDMLVLSLYFWIEKPFHYQNCDEVIADMSRLAAMVRAICEMAGDRVNKHAYNAISPWWQEVREMLLESPKSLGIMVAIVCKTVANILRRNCREGSFDENEENECWEQISHDEAQWSLLIAKLEDVAVLGAILEYPIISTEPVMPQLPYVRPDCSLKFIVSGGKGIVTDLAAQWLINSRIHPSKIVEQEIISTETNKAVEEKETNNTTETEEPITNVLNKSNANTDFDVVLDKLKLLRRHFPFSLESGVLLSLMSFQYMVHWSKNLQSIEYFRAALTCLAQFKTEDFALKHGMCCTLWNATLKYPLKSTMTLVHKVGRLPKNKMCQQDIEISASVIPDFLELSLEFLGHFSTSLDHKGRELKFEENLAEGQIPLQLIALQQHNAIKELLRLHYELCMVLHFITFFQLKVNKPITTLFDSLSNKAFFADINKELPFTLPEPDIVLQQQREDFLCNVITASMDLIREDLEQLFLLEHMEYMKKIVALAHSWKMDKTGLIKRQIVELYAHSYDAFAESLLSETCIDEKLGTLLLEIAGRRLNLYSNSSQQAYLKIASIGQQLLYFLDDLRENPTKFTQITASESEEIELVALTKLVTKAFECLSRHETTYTHICAQMYDACKLLQR